MATTRLGRSSVEFYNLDPATLRRSLEVLQSQGRAQLFVGSSDDDTAMADANEHDVTFESTDSGSAMTFPLQCSALRKNGHVVIKTRPCKIIDMSTSKTGKHGHAKVNLVATDIFTGRKYEDLSPSTHNMDVPIITRMEYTLIDIEKNTNDEVKGRGFLSLMTEDGTMKEDVKVPDSEIGDKIIADFEQGLELMVTVVSAMGEEHAMSHKEAPKGNN
ncbi:translation initiation factor eIF5A [Coemansia sp. RSA 1591]|nr:translation initiation factor eIF5A [Coemansia sp. RSA 1591]KAJ1768172.1 translation initiation factor eIF5A [Coemansia sp. RSA 1752]